jgi:glycosyltransferase involved in cell wall biosynthesis
VSADAVLLVPVMPAAGGNGLAMRAGLLLEGLARCCSVHVLIAPVFGGPGPPSDLVRRLAASCRVLEVDRAADARADLMARLPVAEQRARAQELFPRPTACLPATLRTANAVAQAASRADLVVVMRLYLAPFLDSLLESSPRPPLVLDVDDIESRTQPQLGDQEEGRRFERLEAHYLPLMDAVLTCSDADAEELGARHRLNAVAVVPNAVRLPERPLDAPPRFDLLFVANLSYLPNVDGARWLCQAVLPRLGEATVALVGSSPRPEVRELAADPRVTLAGDVPDVAPWYAAARVAAVPVRIGGGTRIKSLEAFAHRRPVVSTKLGVEGIGWANSDGPVLVADTPDAFAAACGRLLSDPVLAARLAGRGEARVRQHATIERVAGKIEELAVSIVDA